MSEPAPRREIIGLVFRGLREELDRRGLTDRVLEHLQGQARELLEHPPLHSTWLPAPLHDQIVQAIARATNRQTVRDVGYAVAKGSTGPVSLPLIKTFLTLFGATPVSLLNNLNRIIALQTRGVTASFESETPRSGVLTVMHPEPVDPLLFAVWEGVLAFGKDIFNIPVTVGTAVLDPDGRSARIRVAW